MEKSEKEAGAKRTTETMEAAEAAGEVKKTAVIAGLKGSRKRNEYSLQKKLSQEKEITKDIMKKRI